MGNKITFTFLLTLGGAMVYKGMDLVNNGQYIEGALVIIGGGFVIGIGAYLFEKGLIEYQKEVSDKNASNS